MLSSVLLEALLIALESPRLNVSGRLHGHSRSRLSQTTSRARGTAEPRGAELPDLLATQCGRRNELPAPQETFLILILGRKEVLVELICCGEGATCGPTFGVSLPQKTYPAISEPGRGLGDLQRPLPTPTTTKISFLPF